MVLANVYRWNSQIERAKSLKSANRVFVLWLKSIICLDPENRDDHEQLEPRLEVTLCLTQ